MPARRKPTAELEASGALARNPGRHADRLNEPQPELGVANKPDFLSPLAEKHWDSFRKMLTDTRVLTESDAISLAMLCEAFAEWRMHTDRVMKEKTRLPAAQRDLDRSFARLLKIQQEFGMTPASRSRVQAAPKKPEENKFGAMASKRGQPYQGDKNAPSA